MKHIFDLQIIVMSPGDIHVQNMVKFIPPPSKTLTSVPWHGQWISKFIMNITPVTMHAFSSNYNIFCTFVLIIDESNEKLNTGL